MNTIYGKPIEILSKKLDLVSNKYNNLASSQMELLKLLAIILKDTPCIEHNKSIVKRVHRKNDIMQNPIIYTYFNLNEFGEIFYYLDEKTSKFIKMSKDDFENTFACYEEDLIESEGKNPWDIKEIVTEEKSLETSSGNISYDGGNGKDEYIN